MNVPIIAPAGPLPVPLISASLHALCALCVSIPLAAVAQTAAERDIPIPDMPDRALASDPFDMKDLPELEMMPAELFYEPDGQDAEHDD